nr:MULTISPECIES: hypothetical protein [unclassified Synechocystis]
MVVLGLNPGVGYPELQSRDGVWANRIRQTSFSKCFDRSPPGDQAWLKLHVKESPYWRSLMSFGQRCCGNNFEFSQILNFELYPWHSSALTSALNCPPSIIDLYVFQPLAEVQTRHIFAFGKPWDKVFQGLGLTEVRRYGDGFQPLPGVSTPGWTVVIFRSALMTVPIIVSWQQGYAGPPGKPRLQALRAIIENEG